MVNPDNIPIDEETKLFPASVADRVPGMLRKCAACYAVIVIVATALLFKRKLPKDPNADASIHQAEVV
eukprot:CAMPEP_0176359088 /NCGR_PEP_ID=MMETSP0126-20121128/16050_1 /TAXON_ID=141414 ORGANISM="Strombidinopsis acuminatum, Strain SPMC142" /NCGR_SAMPLE_ID=MMETSP0126 /ASSEMBLY_ACC=CAM_ASM_000229 /LENGTH=67 /DNA_ID=CAMNT_0017713599 /DNA_START=1 /DNA_END=204 /DNA_ORIENTATION=+